jgi:hypothetical protein
MLFDKRRAHQRRNLRARGRRKLRAQRKRLRRT